MRISCYKGYYEFREDEPGEVAKFNSYYSQDLTSVGAFFTFALLADAPVYSVQGRPYLGLVATKTFAGSPAEVLEANGLIYDFILGAVVPAASVLYRVDLARGRAYGVSRSLLIPGSIAMADGSADRVAGYSAHFDHKTLLFKYSEVSYG